LVRDQQIEKGRLELKQAIQLDPKHSLAHFRNGEVLLADNHLSEAEHELRIALLQDPDSADFLNALALVLLRENRLADAVTLLQKAVRQDPNRYALHLKLARALQDLGDRKSAAREFARGAELMKSANSLGQVKMLVSSAVGDLRAGNPEHALKQLNEAAELLPDHPETNYYLAIALAESGQFSAANGAFERALDGRPDSAEMHYNFGIALWQQQQAESAIRQFRLAVRLNSADGQAHCALALSLLRSGQPTEGKHELKNAQLLGVCVNPVAESDHTASPGGAF
jgi:Tfp pilus assembly protein PilF